MLILMSVLNLILWIVVFVAIYTSKKVSKVCNAGKKNNVILIFSFRL